MSAPLAWKTCIRIIQKIIWLKKSAQDLEGRSEARAITLRSLSGLRVVKQVPTGSSLSPLFPALGQLFLPTADPTEKQWAQALHWTPDCGHQETAMQRSELSINFSTSTTVCSYSGCRIRWLVDSFESSDLSAHISLSEGFSHFH